MRHQVVKVIGEADAAARHRERCGEDNLPDHQEGKPAAHPVRAVCFPQVVIAAAGLGQRRTEFRPHQAIAGSQHRSHQPSQHRLRASHRGKEKGDGDVRSDAHHVGDGERCGLHQAQFPPQTWRVGRGLQASPVGRRSPGNLAKQFCFHARMGAGRFGGEGQKVDRFRGFADPRQAIRAAACQMRAKIRGVLLRERAQQPQLVEFF